MTPAQRERLRVALERETGVEWTHAAGWADYVDSHDWTVFRQVGRAYLQRRRVYMAAFCLDPHATGRGWPERLAVEVGRVIRESNNSPARVGEE